jgi:hypothetical protein
MKIDGFPLEMIYEMIYTRRIFHIYLSLLEGILHVRLLKKLNVIWFKDQNQIARILNDETDVYCVYMICICIIYILYHIAGHIP